MNIDTFVRKTRRMPNGCIEWLGYLDADGYGRYYANYPNTVYVHRIAFERTKGSIPEGMQVDHICFNRKCLNPDHLQLLTASENARRISPEGRLAWRLAQERRRQDVTHCQRGHEFSADNTKVDRRGQRSCKTCARRAEQKRQARRDAAALRGA